MAFRDCILILCCIGGGLIVAAGSRSNVTSAHAPEQIRLSLGDSYSQMQVMWATVDNVRSWVTYWIEGDPQLEEKMKKEGEVVRLSKNNAKALPFIHRAVLQNLQEGVTYIYQVHKDDSISAFSSDVYHFTTLSDNLNKTHPHSFLMYGDLGAPSRSVGRNAAFLALAEEVRTRNYLAVWHIGDISYQLYDDGGAVGDEFLRSVEPFAAIVPFMVSPGNHENEDDGDFYHYRTRFSTPGTRWPIPLDRMFYSVDIGLVHFISYSSEAYYYHWWLLSHWQEVECKQYYWLLEDLMRANDNRDKVPWIVALGHRPMYCSNDDGDDCTPLPFRGKTRNGLEGLFHAQGVDMIVEAHEHSYERLWPVFNGNVIGTSYLNPRGSVHVISGAAGNPWGPNPMRASTKPWSAFRHDSPDDNNYGRLHVANATHLQWQQVTVKDAEVIDSFWLVQENHGPFVDQAEADCRDTSESRKPRICSCPLPWVFWIALDVASLLLTIITVLIVGIVIWKRRKSLLRHRFGEERPYVLYEKLRAKESSHDDGGDNPLLHDTDI